MSEEEEEKVEKIFDEHLIISLHEHTFVTPENLNEIVEFRRQGRDWAGYEGLSLSGLDVVVENVMIGTAFITSAACWEWKDRIHEEGRSDGDVADLDVELRAEK